MTASHLARALGTPASALRPDASRRSARSGLRPALTDLLTTLLVGVGLLAALQFGTAIADSDHAVAAWLCMLCMTAPLALAAVLFWAIGRLVSGGERSTER